LLVIHLLHENEARRSEVTRLVRELAFLRTKKNKSQALQSRDHSSKP
jgi:hypothetical protein